MTAPVDVAVGVLFDRDGRFLMAQRPAGKPMAGYWEFPGGKVEAGESVFDALVREFDEELGLSIGRAHSWMQRVFAYPHAIVRLHFWRSFAAMGEWSGLPMSREGQAFAFQDLDEPTVAPWLPGALPLRRWLRLPPLYAISNASAIGVEAFVAALERRIAGGSIRQLQLREPAMPASAFAALFDAAWPRCREAGIRLVVNSVHPPSLWSRADGVHWTARDLMTATRRPDVAWCFASCHRAVELDHAAALDVDAVTLGSVKPTASHPGRPALGWTAFEEAIAATPVPVYALGGLESADLTAAIEHGAHGIAMIRGAWER